jgi:hypothetical protein
MFVADSSIFGFLCLVAWWIIWHGINKKIREDGGHVPTRGQMRQIRRNAKKLGITQPAAFGMWHAKQVQKNLKDVNPTASIGAMPSAIADQLHPAPPALTQSSQHEGLAALYFHALITLVQLRGLDLRRQSSGLYLILDLNRQPVANPFRQSSFDFSAEEIERFIAQT